MILSSYLSIHSIPHIAVASGHIPDTIMVNGEERPTRNNRGGLIYPTLSGIRNFWSWFDDSKVVDEHGRPILCFHGTRKDFEFFDGYEIPGWVSEDEELAHSYSRSTVYDDSDSDSEDGDDTPKREPSSNIMPLYVKITNPFRVSENMDDVHEEVNTHAFMVKCEHSGHDGMFGYEGDSRTWAIFNPNQAKSATGNSGMFSHSASVTASTDTLEPTSATIAAAKSFFFTKWKERAAANGRTEPTDLSNACKFGSLFAQGLFGGEIRGNWHHQFVVLSDGTRIDLGEDAADRQSHGNDATWYKHDRSFFGNKDHSRSMDSCRPRVDEWVREFKSNFEATAYTDAPSLLPQKI